MVKGGGLKIRCVMLRGFESHLNYHALEKAFQIIFPNGSITTAFIVRHLVRLAQLAEHRSYEPKVGSSILPVNIWSSLWSKISPL